MGALAGCGSSSQSHGGPLATALSYLPAKSPLVVRVATDPRGRAVSSAQSLLARIPLARFGEAALQAKLGQLGINYDTDIRPLLGNPLVFGATTQTLSSRTGREFVFAWVVKDAATLRSDLKKAHQHSTGTHDGATLYPFSSGALAVQGSTLVASGDAAALRSALDRHAHGSGMTVKAYTAAVRGLPGDALLEVFGSLSGELSNPSAATARRVPWVAAIKSYAIAMSAASNGLALHYRVDTSGISLSSNQLPFAAVAGPPALAGTMPIQVGIRDPAHVVAFIESALRATQPGTYRALLRRQAALRRRTHVDFNDLVRLITGDLIVESDGHTTLARATVSNPATARRVLAKLSRAPARLLFTSSTTIRRRPDGLYTIAGPRSKITAGLVGNQLVVGNGSVGPLRSFARAPTTVVNGARGAVAFRLRVADLVRLATHGRPSRLQQTILGLVGYLTGWSADSPSALTGSAALAIR